MSENQIHLLQTRRFLPLFATQALGALNDNVFKNALVVFIIYRIAETAGLNGQVLVTAAAGIFILPFFLFSATAGQIAVWLDGVEVSTITVTVRDANSNPVAGQTVQLAATGSNNTVTQPAGPTNASGVATGTIASTTAEVKTITVTVNPGPSQVVLTDTPTVEFVADPKHVHLPPLNEAGRVALRQPCRQEDGRPDSDSDLSLQGWTFSARRRGHGPFRPALFPGRPSKSQQICRIDRRHRQSERLPQAIEQIPQ